MIFINIILRLSHNLLTFVVLLNNNSINVREIILNAPLVNDKSTSLIPESYSIYGRSLLLNWLPYLIQ